ncbi:MAG: hypothetical protein HDR24_09335 [Lachnospiraceae bacterium]|nr:hypothetical protein [Lachnospiraceae bacterium]
MAFNEQIVTGRKFRKLVDETTKLWQRISFWTKASDVEFDNGMTAEMKMGAIDGITDSLASTSSRIAASAKSVATLNSHLAQQPNFIYDSTGKITGYKTPGGADTVFPFKNSGGDGSVSIITSSASNATSLNVSNINGYENFTIDNFGFVITAPIGSDGTVAYIGHHDNYNTSLAAGYVINKSYDKTTGVFTGSISAKGGLYNNDSKPSWEVNGGSMTVYQIPAIIVLLNQE